MNSRSPTRCVRLLDARLIGFDTVPWNTAKNHRYRGRGGRYSFPTTRVSLNPGKITAPTTFKVKPRFNCYHAVVPFVTFSGASTAFSVTSAHQVRLGSPD